MSDYRMFKQAFETLVEQDCKDGYTINPFTKTITSKDGVCPTITTRPEGFKTAILIVEKTNE